MYLNKFSQLIIISHPYVIRIKVKLLNARNGVNNNGEVMVLEWVPMRTNKLDVPNSKHLI